MTENKSKQINNSLPEIQNGLLDLAGSVGSITQQNQIARPDTLNLNLRNYMISNDQHLLSALYVEQGLIQTIVKQPIDDAYREPIIIQTGQLDDEQIKQVSKHFYDNMFDQYIEARKWGRLFGGAGLVINDNDDYAQEFNINKINSKTPIEFYPANRWELNYQASGQINGGAYTRLLPSSDNPYDYYGLKLHKSRVLRIVGEEAPPLLRLQLMGWGMSIVEKLVQPLNTYVKTRDVMYEVIDEAKIDVFQIDGYNSALLNDDGTSKIAKRIQAANMIKSYLNALTMDINDKYEQKTQTFSGLAEVNQEGRMDLACAFRMPLTKLFGVSSAGFNSGEDDLENYNAMVESEIRSKDKKNLITLLEIACMKVFGFVPDDLTIDFVPLRYLDAEQEENVKNAKMTRIQQAKEMGLIDDGQAIEAINKADLLPITIKE